MNSRSYLRLRVSVLVALLIALSSAPAALAARVTDQATSDAALGDQADLAPVLGPDGTFVGSEHVSGSVDTHRWTLVSNLQKGEPPRFEQTSTVAPAAISPGAWSALGCCWDGSAGTGALVSHVYAVAVSGSNVYVGGLFFNAGNVAAADYIAKWDGTSWSALGGAAPFASGYVNAILVDGANIYIGGSFSNAGGDAEADYLALWNGSVWTDVAGSVTGVAPITGEVHALAKNGSTLYVGGFFYNSPVITTGTPNAGDMILSWDGAWHSLGQRPCCTDTGNGALNGAVRALLATSTGVIAGGTFTDVAADTTIDYLAEYTSELGTWARVGNLTPNSHVYALAGSPTNLYIGGNFTDANGITPADYFARWNGVEWSAPGGSNGVSAIQDRVYAIRVSGSNVYVGGNFLNAGGLTPKPTADRVARWNGSTWSGLGSNGLNEGALLGGSEPPGYVRALGLSTNALYAGGSFINASNIPEADYIAAYGTGTTTNQKPDGRIKLGSGSYVGNNIYNTTGLNQTRTGSAVAGGTITFTISIQNDGTQGGKFKVASTASGNVNYEVKYFRGTTDITAAVVAGSYVTGSVPVGNLFNITARVKVLPAAIVGSTTTRLITITSNANATKIDAVKLVGKRK